MDDGVLEFFPENDRPGDLVIGDLVVGDLEEGDEGGTGDL